MPRSVSVTDTRILDAFDRFSEPVCTVHDLSQHLPLKPDSVRYRLKQLEEDGKVRSKEVGSRAVVWWRER